MSNFPQAANYEGGLTRRLFLAYGAALNTLPWLTRSARSETAPKFSADPFSLGVASGDPDADSVVIWTRLAPAPLEPAGGMANRAVDVAWELATDDSMKSIAASGKTIATPQLAHSVHVEVPGLLPDRWYWFRFRSGDAQSPIGRTRTLPERHVMPGALRFAVASCQNYEQGLFTAYEQMARDEVDLVFHLGDYIYEHESGRDGNVRKHEGGEIQSLEDYRIRHAQYRSDPLLQNMHAQCPWFVTWDDHEVDNNYASETSEESDVDPATFLARRANAYQAYYEMMPLRSKSLPKGPHMRLYRRASFGRLAELLILDTRQYRTDQPNNDSRSPLNSAALDSANSMLGRAQRNWLCQKLISSLATWNVLAQQVMMGMVADRRENGEPLYSMDQWPGCAAERTQLMQFLAERKVPNPVVLTGDIHSNWVNELRIDDREPETELVGTEFVATSISSGGNGVKNPPGLQQLLAANPGVKFHNGQRGYICCHVTGHRWQADYMVVDDVLRPGGKVFAQRSFVLEAGAPTVHPA